MNPIDAYTHLYNVAGMAFLLAGTFAVSFTALLVVFKKREKTYWKSERERVELLSLLHTLTAPKQVQPIDYRELQKIVNTTKQKN